MISVNISNDLLQVMKDLTQALNRFAAVFESDAGSVSDPLVASTEPERTAAQLSPEPVDAAPPSEPGRGEPISPAPVAPAVVEPESSPDATSAPAVGAPSKPKRIRDRKKPATAAAQPEPAPVPESAPLPPAPLDPEAEFIAKHIAEKGVTRCPAAAVGETAAEIPPEDLEAIRQHEERRIEAVKAEAKAQPSQGKRNMAMGKL